MSTPNTTPLTYNGYVTQIATMAVVNTTTTNGVVVGVDPAFNAIIPQMLNYAELRIQRDLDLLPLETFISTYSTTAGSGYVPLSVNDFVTISTINVTSSSFTVSFSSGSSTISGTGLPTTAGTPVTFSTTGSLPSNFSTSTTYYVLPGSTSTGITVSATVGGTAIVASGAGTGVQTMTQQIGQPLLPVAKSWLQNVYGQPAYTSLPQYFSMTGGDYATGGNTYNYVDFGPVPDQNYNLMIRGTIRMPSLYQNATTALANTGTTFISTYLPDLLIMASMVYISAYQRNFGRMSDDPTMAQSYEGQYDMLLKSAMNEEYRKRFEASGWTSLSTPSAATPTRG